MNFTGKKVLSKLVAIIVIMAMTMSDFALVGANLVSYAVDVAKTTANNVEFSSYFVNENGEKVSKIEKDVDTSDLKMYVEVSVKNEGYFDGEISIENANFKIENNILSETVNKIESNIVYLNRINAGKNAVIELEIQKDLPDSMPESLLSTQSQVNLTGKYTDSKKTQQISGKSKIEVDWKTSNDAKAEITLDALTNKTYDIEGKSKHIAQFLLTSKVTNNCYPVKNTKIDINVPEGAEEVYVTAKSTSATNGGSQFSDNNYKYNKESGVLSINVENQPDKDGNIKFNKNTVDEFIITYIYSLDGNVNTGSNNNSTNTNMSSTIARLDLNNEEIEAVTTITTYDNQQKENKAKVILNEEKDGIVTYNIENNEKEIYKGKIYTGEERSYETTTKVNINKANIAEKITVSQEASLYVADDVYKANIFLSNTKILKSEFEEIFKDDGYIKIFDNQGTVLANITKETQADENGYVVINYAENITEVKIETSKPYVEGTLNIINTKTIKETSYDRAKIGTFTHIREAISGVYNNEENVDVEESKITLKDTSSKATLNVTNKSLSTTETTNTRITVILETDKESKDLYKNPSIKVTLPKQVKKIDIKYELLHGNGLQIANEKIEKEGENLVILFNLTGEQTKYVTDVTEGPTLVIDAVMEQDNLTVTSKEQIKVNYTNENAKTYEDNGEEKVDVSVIAKNPVIVTNKINELNIETSQEDRKDIELEIASQAKELTNIMDVVNNETSKITDVRILGKYPTNNSSNNLGITISTQATAVTKKDVKIYYSTEENPTDDQTDAKNKWTEKSDASTNSYLIVIDSLEVGEKFTFGYKMNIPADLKYNLSAETGYSVSYKNEASNTSNTVKATTLELNTGKSAVLEQTIVATVGGEEIKDGDTVKTGEIVKYTVTIKNSGNEDATGINIVGNIPDGTNYIEYNKNIEEPSESVPSDEPETLIEDTNKKQVKLENQTIKAKSQITLEYMVKVNTNESKEISATIAITNSKGETKESKITNKIDASDIEVTMLKSDSIYNNGTLKSGYGYQYILKIKNTSKNDKNNVQVDVNTNDLLQVMQIEYNKDDEDIEIENSSFTVEKLKANEELNISVLVRANQATSSLKTASLSAKVKDNKGEYRSNEITENIDSINLEVNFTAQTTSNAEGYLHKGDKVAYTLNIKNTGKIDAQNLEIKDEFSDYLVLEGITVNNQQVNYVEDDIYEEGAKYSIITIPTPLKAGETANVIINAKVDDSIEYDELTKVTNKATLYNEIEISSTDEITYLIEKTIDENNAQDNGDASDNEDNGNNGNGETGNNTTENQTNQNGNENENGNGNGDGDGNNSSNGQTANSYTIAGTAWKDENENGARDQGEELLADINVKLLNIETKKFVTDASGNEVTAKTNSEGLYNLTNVPAGKYIAVFEYDTSKYMLTTYKADGVQSDKNSDAILNNITVNEETKQMAITDTINLVNSIANIDIGLVDAKVFDVELEKYITKIAVTNSAGTSTYEYKDSTLAKADIAAKNLSDSQVVIEYTIKVKNAGEIAGYVKNVVDYKSTELDFSSTLNKDWYSKGDDLYNASLANTKLEPGETKELKLVLTKTMTESNTGLIGNTAEIAEAYNTRGASDKDSTAGNKAKNEDDMGQADVILGVKTGAAISYIIITLSIITVITVAGYLVSKKVLNKEIKF